MVTRAELIVSVWEDATGGRGTITTEYRSTTPFAIATTVVRLVWNTRVVEITGSISFAPSDCATMWRAFDRSCYRSPTGLLGLLYPKEGGRDGRQLGVRGECAAHDCHGNVFIIAFGISWLQSLLVELRTRVICRSESMGDCGMLFFQTRCLSL